MKKLLVAAMLLTVSINAFSQDNPIVNHEIGLIFSNLNSFGVRYKWGNGQTMFRLTSVVLTGAVTGTGYDDYTVNGVNGKNIPNSTSNTIGPGLNIGIEKRRRINNDFYIYGGIDWINSYTRTQSNSTTPSYSTYNNAGTLYTAMFNNSSNSLAWTLSSGLGVALGTSYNVSHALSVAVELEPSITYRYTKTTTSSTNYGVSTWNSNGAGGYTPTIYQSSKVNQTTFSSGVTESLSNATASITLSYKW